MEHTEGEWTLNQIGKNGWDVLCGLNQTIAQVFKCYLSEPAEAEANARLIAAAPALLAACEAMVTCLTIGDCCQCPINCPPTINLARSKGIEAIAEAKK